MSENNNNERSWLRKLIGENGRRGVSFASISAGIGILGALGGIVALAADAGAQKEKIQQLEQRQIEDRALTRDSLQKIEAKVVETDKNVVKILIKLETLEALRDAERRRP